MLARITPCAHLTFDVTLDASISPALICFHRLPCRYRVSIYDVLDETLLALAEADRSSGAGAERAELFQYIREGVNDFVRFLDPASFYGLVDGVTVAAYVLRAAQVPLTALSLSLYTSSTLPHASCFRDASNVLRFCFSSTQATLAANSRTPVIDAPLHVAAESGAGDASEGISAAGNEPGAGLLSGSTMQHINKYIRAINFQLLEICRPEALILKAPTLPRAYVREYFEQDHLSAANVIKAFAASQCKVRWLVRERFALGLASV